MDCAMLSIFPVKPIISDARQRVFARVFPVTHSLSYLVVILPLSGWVACARSG